MRYATTITVLLAVACGAVARGDADKQPVTGVMATVNGEPLDMADLNRALIRAYGGQVAQQLIANEVVRQAVYKRGLKVSEDDVTAENERTLERMFGGVTGDAQREQLLEQLLVRRGIPRQQWEMTMWRNAALRKMAANRVEITEAELREEFEEQFGRKVLVRHIQTASLADAQMVLERLKSDEADFAELARRFSTNASAQEGGLLPPIGVKAVGLPPAIRDVALSLKRPGEITDPVQVGTTFHILKLERILPPEGADFDDVRDRLAADLREKEIRILQQRVLAELIDQADIEIVNPVLKSSQRDSLGEIQP